MREVDWKQRPSLVPPSLIVRGDKSVWLRYDEGSVVCNVLQAAVDDLVLRSDLPEAPSSLFMAVSSASPLHVAHTLPQSPLPMQRNTLFSTMVERPLMSDDINEASW